jgi:hypothetical protein
MKRSGTADLPLHYGKVPAWLYERMSVLGLSIGSYTCRLWKRRSCKTIIRSFWFQSFGAVLGMDWHSSGITTSVMGALKRAINPNSQSLGIFICGGKENIPGIPRRNFYIADKTGLNGTELVKASKLSAKVDNTAIQDGYQLYQHNFVVTDNGNWCVIQQGFNRC